MKLKPGILLRCEKLVNDIHESPPNVSKMFFSLTSYCESQRNESLPVSLEHVHKIHFSQNHQTCVNVSNRS